MAPTPALWALLRWTCSPVANRIPSLTAIERCENDAMSSSFHPETEMEKKGNEEKKKNYTKTKQANPSTKVHTPFKQNETDNKGGIPMNQLSCAVKACSFHKHRHRVITKAFESYAFWRDRRVKGMNCACHHNKDSRLDVPKQGLDTESTEDTRRCLLSDRAPLTVLPGNTRLFSPELSWVWETSRDAFICDTAELKRLFIEKPESWEETSSPE